MVVMKRRQRHTEETRSSPTPITNPGLHVPLPLLLLLHFTIAECDGVSEDRLQGFE